jgi:transposase-like protein
MKKIQGKKVKRFLSKHKILMVLSTCLTCLRLDLWHHTHKKNKIIVREGRLSSEVCRRLFQEETKQHKTSYHVHDARMTQMVPTT